MEFRSAFLRAVDSNWLNFWLIFQETFDKPEIRPILVKIIINKCSQARATANARFALQSILYGLWSMSISIRYLNKYFFFLRLIMMNVKTDYFRCEKMMFILFEYFIEIPMWFWRKKLFSNNKYSIIFVPFRHQHSETIGIINGYFFSLKSHNLKQKCLLFSRCSSKFHF